MKLLPILLFICLSVKGQKYTLDSNYNFVIDSLHTNFFIQDSTQQNSITFNEYDSSISIEGDTMQVIKFMVKESMRLYKKVNERDSIITYLFEHYNFYEKPKEINTDIPID